MGYLYGPIHKAGEEKLKIFQREKKKKKKKQIHIQRITNDF